MQSLPSESISRITLRRFVKNPWGVMSFICLLLFSLMAVLAYALAPDYSENANQIQLDLHSMPPGFQQQFLQLPDTLAQPESALKVFFKGTAYPSVQIPVTETRALGDTLYYQAYVRDGLPAPDEAYVLASAYGLSSAEQLQKQQLVLRRFHLGTDKYGRDLLSRMLVGSRISLSIGLVAVFISLLLGITMGALGGYFGGKVDAVVMWLVNVIWSVPTLLLVIAITLALGKGFWQVFVAVGLTMWVEVARVVRGQIMSVKEQQYVKAARALGFSDYRIIFKHLLPNVLAPVIVISAANFASAVLIESGLSFLGLGAQPPIPSWGGIIKDHYHYVVFGKPYLALVPGLAIMILTLLLMNIGNALRDALDVKL